MTTPHSSHQKICDDLTQVQLGLDDVLETLFTQAGERLQSETQAELKQNVENTKQRLEKLKSNYSCSL